MADPAKAPTLYYKAPRSTKAKQYERAPATLSVIAKKHLKDSFLDSTSKATRDDSDTLMPLGTIASAKVLHQLQSSFAGVASVKVFHKP